VVCEHSTTPSQRGFFVPLCYDADRTGCTNEVTEPLTYCLPCKQKHYPTHPKTIAEKPPRFVSPVSTDQKESVPAQNGEQDLYTLSFEELKAKEIVGSNWLINNRHLEKQEPEKWRVALHRYHQVVHYMNLKTDMSGLL
jgi:hypothetical protein